MGLDVFVYCYANGEPAEVPTCDLLACFEGFISFQDPKCVDLRFGATDSCTLYLDTQAPTTSGFLLARPCGDRRLGACLYSVMQLGNFSLLIPGEEGVIVPSTAAIDHLPPEMLQSCGGPKVALNLEAFQRLFFPS